MPADVCQTCGRPLPRQAGKRGRTSVYCSSACRQRAYRARQAPAGGDAVRELISDIGQRVQRLAPQLPGAFYEDVNELSSSVGRLRRIAKVAVDAAQSTDAGDVARTSDEWDFAAMVEPHRKEIQLHCYQMVGSYDDSEDLVQETFLRAWRHRDGFEGRASLRTWLYKIATNACLDFLRRNQRRPQKYDALPGFDHGSGEPPDRFNWLQPYPDELLASEAQPEAAAVSNETLELVFLAAIQHLPPRQRAVLIMRDALGWQAAETAEVLEMSVASVNSALQRARPTLREHLPRQRSDWSASVTATDEERELLRRYMEAAVNADVNAMADMLSVDVKLTMPPNPYWFLGRDAIVDFVTPVFDTNSPAYHGLWRHLPTRANRQPALGGYVQRVGTTVYRAQVLDVLRVVDGKIVEITSFEPHLFPAFGLPMTLPR